MKVYILTMDPFPVGFAGTNRIRHYGKGLVRARMDCEVVVLYRTERSNIVNKNAKGESEGVKFRYVAGSTERSTNFIRRRIDDICADLRLLRFLTGEIKRGDAILWFIGGKGVIYTGLVQIICACKGVKIVRELCELPYVTSSDSIWKKLQRWCYSRISMPGFDGFISISEELSLYAQRVAPGVSNVKVPILVDVDQYNDIVSHKHHRPYIFHAGTMYERKDAIVSTMKAFAKAARSLNYGVDFILAGPKSPHHQELQEIIKDYHIEDNVHFIGSITHSEVLSYQKGASLSILNKNDNLQNRCGFSTKLGDILLAGVPVLTTTVGEANFFLKDGESAYICEPHNIDAVTEKIEEAFADEAKRIQIGAAGREIAKHYFDCNMQGVRLRNFFETL